MPAPPSQTHLPLPAVTQLYAGEHDEYQEGSEDDLFGPSPTYEPSLLWDSHAEVVLMEMQIIPWRH